MLPILMPFLDTEASLVVVADVVVVVVVVLGVSVLFREADDSLGDNNIPDCHFFISHQCPGTDMAGFPRSGNTLLKLMRSKVMEQ